MACWGIIFTKKSQFKKNSFSFYYIYFFHVITAPMTLKEFWIFQSFALIRAVLLEVQI